MIKKTLVFGALALSTFGTAIAGGILTNTNQSARFARLMALEATTTTDAAYYNPAGTIKLSEGFHFSFSNQSAFQKRIITSSFAPLTGAGSKTYTGTASAPIIPSLQGVYRKGKWALSGNLAIVGGGGKATFSEGLPMFESQIAMLAPMLNGVVQGGALALPPGGVLKAKGYSVNQYMEGSNYIFGGQIGGAYEINEMFSVYGGVRLNIVHNKYEGSLTNLQLDIEAKNLTGLMPDYDGLMNPTPIIDMALNSGNVPQAIKDKLDLPSKMAGSGAHLDSKQSGWGIAPIIGAHFSYNGLNIGAKYEFKAALDVENKTQVDDTDKFENGVNTAHDVPAMFAMGASYDIISQVTVNVGYHHFFDKDASMANEKQRYLTGGTNEYLFGAEWRIDKMFLVSMGGQITKYGLADGFQSDLSFSVNSFSLGFGGAVNVSENVQINAGYFFTDYSDYTKESASYNDLVGLDGQPIAGTDVFTRKNKVFSIGVDFSF